MRQGQFGLQKFVEAVKNGERSEVECIGKCRVKYDIFPRAEKRLDVEEGFAGGFDHCSIRAGRSTWRKLSTGTSIVSMRLL